MNQNTSIKEYGMMSMGMYAKHLSICFVQQELETVE